MHFIIFLNLTDTKVYQFREQMNLLSNFATVETSTFDLGRIFEKDFLN